MKFVEVRFPLSSALIAPVPRSQLVTLEILLRKLYERWIELKLSTSDLMKENASWKLMIQIANFFPRLDTPGKTGFDLSLLHDDPDQVEALFLAQTDDDDSLTLPKLVELNCFEPLPIPAWRIDDEAEPTPSSGDPDMDLLAMLSVSSNVQDAAFLMDRLSAYQLDRYLFYLAELRRDPEDRKKETLAADYSAWKEENVEAVREALGIRFDFPTSEPDKIPAEAVPD